MAYNLFITLIVILFLCNIVIIVDLSIPQKYSRYIIGVMFGLITIFIMHTKLFPLEGHFFDLRHIPMTMAGFIGGPITALIAAIISSLYRYTMGGPGVIGGIAEIVIFACFGSMLSRYVKRSKIRRNLLFWFIMGFVMVLIEIVIIICLPQIDYAKVFKLVSVPFLTITPLATTLLFNVYYWSYDFFSKAAILNSIINSSSLNLAIFDRNGPILLSQNLKQQRQLSASFEKLSRSVCSNSWLNSSKKQEKEIVTEDGRSFIADLSSFRLPKAQYACIAIVNDVTDRKREQDALKNAEKRFHNTFQFSPHMMTIIRADDHTYIDANRQFLESKGFERAEVIGRTPIQLGVPEREFKQQLEILETQGLIQNFEGSFIMKYGLKGIVIVSAEKIQIDHQECILFAYNDITDMKRMQVEWTKQLTQNSKLEQDLSNSNELVADIINNIQAFFFVLDNQWNLKYVNKKIEELFLKKREHILNKVFWEVMPKAQGTLFEINFRKAKRDGIPITFESLGFIKQDRWYEITVYPDEYGLSVYYMDITELKLARQKLMKSQEEKALILETMNDCFYAIDMDWQLTDMNRAAEIAFEKSRDELLGKKITDVFKLNDIAIRHYQEVMSEKRPVSFEIISEMLGNKWFEISAYPIENGMTCYFRNITRRKIVQEALRLSEEKFSKAFHSGPIMMTLATVKEDKFIDCNLALCFNTGYTREEIIGHTAGELNFFVERDKRQALGKILMEQGKIENAELDFRTKSGEIRHGLSWSQLFYWDGEPCHITGLIDVTEKKRIQEEMTRVDRLSLVGQLAAGIGHEIRNPMTTVRGYLQLLSSRPVNITQKPTFDLMISELDRANAIITEFLSLARTKEAELRFQDLNDIVHNLYPLIEADALTQHKQLSFIPGEIPNLELNGNEITQLILNLTRNGLEAMPERGFLIIKSYLEDGKVVLTISDEGCGIPPENLSKLGTPFFTTKDNGTGLGLTICYKIAQSHDAKIHINSSSNGTTFFIVFPIPDEDK
ncbi:MAG TPA: PAS domain S-box protein [Desulfosporosinus sp.]|nr:PAS domain S-box protein [Desulfosporosinus sp.]